MEQQTFTLLDNNYTTKFSKVLSLSYLRVPSNVSNLIINIFLVVGHFVAKSDGETFISNKLSEHHIHTHTR